QNNENYERICLDLWRWCKRELAAKRPSFVQILTSSRTSQGVLKGLHVF
ncbi:hypothetical protein ISN45_Aa06g029600, partial [Arabidopsis thaliana x Arabidopsis arenosa]